MSCQITPPHPTALPNRLTHTGRGGYGNIIKVPSNTTSSSPSPSPASLDSNSPHSTPRPSISISLSRIPSTTPSYASTASRYTSTGRGGYGNILFTTDLAPSSLSPLASLTELEHELDLRRARQMGREVWHTGRGGAGNTSANAVSADRDRDGKGLGKGKGARTEVRRGSEESAPRGRNVEVRASSSRLS